MSSSTTLVLTAGVLEVVGIVLVGAADLVPPARKGAEAAGRSAIRIHRWVQRTVFRRRGAQKVSIGAAGEVNVAGSIATVVLANPGGSTEEKVDFLLRESERSQKRLNKLEAGLKSIRAGVDAGLGSVRQASAQYADETVRGALEQFARARRVGIACLGLALLLWVLGSL